MARITAIARLTATEGPGGWTSPRPGSTVWVGRDPATKGVPMATAEVKSFDSPDEVREFEGNGRAKVVQIAGHTVGLGTFEPGWKWSENVKPIAGTDSCQVSHLGYVLSGSMRVRMDDGTEAE